MLTRILRLLASASLVAALAAVPAASSVSAGGGCHGDLGNVHSEGETTVVRMDVCTFEPTVARVPVGTEVRFHNTAQVTHLVTGDRQSWGSDGEIAPGQEVRHRFAEPGVFPYSCPLHPGMVGAIVVGGTDVAGAAPAAGGETGDTADAAAVSTPAGSGIAPGPLVAVGLAGVAAGATIVLVVAGRRRAVSADAPSAQRDARVA